MSSSKRVGIQPVIMLWLQCTIAGSTLKILHKKYDPQIKYSSKTSHELATKVNKNNFVLICSYNVNKHPINNISWSKRQNEVEYIKK